MPVECNTLTLNDVETFLKSVLEDAKNSSIGKCESTPLSITEINLIIKNVEGGLRRGQEKKLIRSEPELIEVPAPISKSKKKRQLKPPANPMLEIEFKKNPNYKEVKETEWVEIYFAEGGKRKRVVEPPQGEQQIREYKKSGVKEVKKSSYWVEYYYDEEQIVQEKEEEENSLTEKTTTEVEKTIISRVKKSRKLPPAADFVEEMSRKKNTNLKVHTRQTWQQKKMIDGKRQTIFHDIPADDDAKSKYKEEGIRCVKVSDWYEYYYDEEGEKEEDGSTTAEEQKPKSTGMAAKGIPPGPPFTFDQVLYSDWIPPPWSGKMTNRTEYPIFKIDMGPHPPFPFDEKKPSAVKGIPPGAPPGWEDKWKVPEWSGKACNKGQYYCQVKPGISAPPRAKAKAKEKGIEYYFPSLPETGSKAIKNLNWHPIKKMPVKSIWLKIQLHNQRTQKNEIRQARRAQVKQQKEERRKMRMEKQQQALNCEEDLKDDSKDGNIKPSELDMKPTEQTEDNVTNSKDNNATEGDSQNDEDVPLNYDDAVPDTVVPRLNFDFKLSNEEDNELPETSNISSEEENSSCYYSEDTVSEPEDRGANHLINSRIMALTEGCDSSFSDSQPEEEKDAEPIDCFQGSGSLKHLILKSNQLHLDQHFDISYQNNKDEQTKRCVTPDAETDEKFHDLHRLSEQASDYILEYEEEEVDIIVKGKELISSTPDKLIQQHGGIGNDLNEVVSEHSTPGNQVIITTDFEVEPADHDIQVSAQNYNDGDKRVNDPDVVVHFDIDNIKIEGTPPLPDDDVPTPSKTSPMKTNDKTVDEHSFKDDAALVSPPSPYISDDSVSPLRGCESADYIPLNKINVNFKRLCELFFINPDSLNLSAVAKSGGKVEKEKSSSSSNGKRRSMITDAKKQSSIEIMLKGNGLDCSRPETLTTFRKMLRDFDVKGSPFTAIGVVLGNYPTEDLFPDLLAYYDEHKHDESKFTELPNSDLFLVECLKLSPFKIRAECCIVMLSFQEQISSIQVKIDRLFMVTQYIRGSLEHGLLRIFMKLILDMGNFINLGTKREGAWAIPIDELNLCKNIKSADNSLTLLKVVVEHLVHGLPSSLLQKLDITYRNLKDALGYPPEDLDAILENIKGELNRCRKHVEDPLLEEKCRTVLEEFIKASDAQLASLYKDFNTSKDNLGVIALLCGGKQEDVSLGFSTMDELSNVIRDILNDVEELRVLQAKEKKKAEIEKEQERKRVALEMKETERQKNENALKEKQLRDANKQQKLSLLATNILNVDPAAVSNDKKLENPKLMRKNANLNEQVDVFLLGCNSSKRIEPHKMVIQDPVNNEQPNHAAPPKLKLPARVVTFGPNQLPQSIMTPRGQTKNVCRTPRGAIPPSLTPRESRISITPNRPKNVNYKANNDVIHASGAVTDRGFQGARKGFFDEVANDFCLPNGSNTARNLHHNNLLAPPKSYRASAFPKGFRDGMMGTARNLNKTGGILLPNQSRRFPRIDEADKEECLNRRSKLGKLNGGANTARVQSTNRFNLTRRHTNIEK